jgi:uncharacterized protein YecE (DUF72 family)
MPDCESASMIVRYNSRAMPPTIHLGTSAFTAAGWEGAFYPAGMKPSDYLSFYATKFDTVEVDSTFYRCPSPSTVRGWYAKTPKHFVFALKVPQEITHEKVLLDCDAELNAFLAVADLLGEKLGPLVFQFAYFNRDAFAGVNDFLARLVPFLKKLPNDHRFAVEIRNKHWLVPKFADALREHGVALVLQDQSWMPLPTRAQARSHHGGLDVHPLAGRPQGNRGSHEDVEQGRRRPDGATDELGRFLRPNREARRHDLRVREQPLCRAQPRDSGAIHVPLESERPAGFLGAASRDEGSPAF